MFHLTQPQDSLSSLAHSLIGDYSKWRNIADLNNIDIFNPTLPISIQIPDKDELIEMAKAEAINVGREVIENYLDLSPLKKANVAGVNPWQLISWVL